MSEPFCTLSKEQTINLLGHIQNMVDIFEERMATFDAEQRQRFFQSKNRCHAILESSMAEKIG